MSIHLEYLQSQFLQLSQEKYPISSRIHRLKSFVNTKENHYFVKRDDELGFGISGTKSRKYRTLIPYIKQQGYRRVIVIGGAFSNHVLSCSQVLIENEIEPILFLKGPKPQFIGGNFLFSQLLIPSSSIRWINHEEWNNVESLAQEYAKNDPHTFVLAEGASDFHGFLGALSLALDIVRNEKEENIHFDQLYIDSGTGCTASALLLAFAFLRKETFCHILLTADSEQLFLEKLINWHQEFEKWVGKSCPFPSLFRSFKPSLCSSFGATSLTLFSFITEHAKKEGFFLDPIYSAKLFYEAKKDLESLTISGNILLIHSGGAFTLSGFQQQLTKTLSQEST